MVVEHAFIVGLGLLIAVIIAGVTWYWFSRTRGASKSSVLENQARVNSADLDGPMVDSPIDAPSSALAPEPQDQVNEQVEMPTTE